MKALINGSRSVGSFYLDQHIICKAMRSHEQRRDVCRVCGDSLADGMKRRLFDSLADR